MSDTEKLGDHIGRAETATEPTAATPQALAPSIVHIRRALRHFASRQAEFASELQRLVANDGVGTVSPDAAALIVAAAMGLPQPDPDRTNFGSGVDAVRKGQFRQFSADALDQACAMAEIAERALRALFYLDSIGRPLPPGWSNLPPAELARQINSHAFTVFGSALVR